jgi:UDP-N-acetylglucosamine--N-acetylmuramyl-(pentapeptide) pyrophosphoryl-undecaprenol N-acetylglucosamine transferase
MPGIAVAKILASRGWKVSWIGTEQGMERRLVERHGIAFYPLDFEGLRGKGLKTFLFGGFKLLDCIRVSRKLLRELQTDVIFSTGGYVAVPVCLAAGLAGIPYVLMNSDADPLLSIRMIQGNASGVMCGFNGAAAQKAGDKGLVTGNPIRREISALPQPAERYAGRTGPLKLLVFGGSLGARVLNETVPAAVALLKEDERPEIVHQCGVKSVEEVRRRYAEHGIAAEVVPFIDDMASAYAQSDFVISRSGAISVSEFMAAGIPAVMVPLVVKTTSHQLGNAKFVESHGAGICLAQKELTAGKLAETIRGLDREKLLSMAQKAKSMGKPDAALVVADFIETLVKA